MRLSSLRIKNYGCLADFELKDIPPLAVFIGANGSGKSTLFDVFAFLRDCLRNDVTSAVDRRGGYEELHTRETEGPIELDLTAQTDHFDDLRILRYQLAITAQNGRPVIQAERLEEQIGANGQPVARLDPDDELGANSDAQSGDDEAGGLWQQVVQEERRRGRLALSSPFALRPAAGDGAPTFESYFAARLFHDMFTELHLSNVHIDAARQPPQFGRAAHLADDGANVALVTKYMSEEHDQVFTEVIARMQRAVPGLDRIDVKRTDDARIVLRFSDRSFQDPFLARSVSDGTVKLLAYLLLLYDPDPPPLLCIEEPENQLYPLLLEELTEELRMFAHRSGGQALVSTHSPNLLNTAEPQEVFWLLKEAGRTFVRRVSDDEQLVAQHDFGDHLGRMWQSNAFAGAHPE